MKTMYLGKSPTVVPKSAILPEGGPPSRVRNYTLFELLPRGVQPMFDQIVMSLWPLTDAERSRGRDAARFESGEAKVDNPDADTPASLRDIDFGALLLLRYPPQNGSVLGVWETFIRPKGPPSDAWRKFWEKLILASNRLAGRNAFLYAELLVKTVHIIDKISASHAPVDRLPEKSAKNARTTMVNKAHALAKQMERLGISWSVWDLIEWSPELADASPRKNRFLLQPKLGDVPNMVGLLRLLAARLDARVQRSVIGQPTISSAPRRHFTMKLNEYCESIFGTPSHELVAEAAALIFRDLVDEESVRREFSRAKAKRAKAVKQNAEKPTSVYNSRGDKRSSRQLGQTSRKTSTKIDKRVTQPREGKVSKRT